MKRFTLALLFSSLLALPLGAQTPDPVCFSKYSKNADTLAKAHLPSTVLTGYQKRARARLDSLLHAKCVTTPVPVPPIPPPDTQPTPPPTGGTAELPRVVPAYRDPYPGKVCSTTVPDGGDVGAALRAARGGAVVCLAAGGTYSQVQLPARAAGDTGWIVLRTSGLSAPEGTRVTPSTVSAFATIRTVHNGECSLSTTPGTHGWYVAGVKIATAAQVTYTMVCLGAAGAEQDQVSEVPQKLVLSRVIIDGGALDIQRCVGLNSAATAIVDSWIMNCHIRGFEGQGIGSWNSPGSWLIRNNYIEAAGINVLIGGATPAIPNLRTFDVTVQRNHFYKPLAWKGVWTVKNLLETKNAGRVLIEDNVMENSWTDAQTGIGILFKSSNDQGNCNWCQTSDVTFRRNLIRNVETALAITGGENYCRSAPADQVGPDKWCQVRGEVPPSTARVVVSDVVFDDLGSTVWGAKGVYMAPVHSSTGPADVTLERIVTAQGAGKLVAHGLMVSQPGAVRAVFRDMVLSHGTYTILTGNGEFGVIAFNLGAPNAVWSNNWFVKLPNHTEQSTSVPPGTTIITAEPSLAAQIRATVNAAIAGVVTRP
jgi:hypothetical protein